MSVFMVRRKVSTYLTYLYASCQWRSRNVIDGMVSISRREFLCLFRDAMFRFFQMRCCFYFEGFHYVGKSALVRLETAVPSRGAFERRECESAVANQQSLCASDFFEFIFACHMEHYGLVWEVVITVLDLVRCQNVSHLLSRR